MLLLAALLGYSKLIHSLVVVLSSPLKIDCGKRILIFLAWMLSLKVVENRSFWNVYRWDVRQNILAIYNVAWQKIIEYGGEKISCFHWYHPLTISWTVKLYYTFLLYEITSDLVLFGPAWPKCRFGVWNTFLRPIFCGDFWNSPFMLEICTSVVLLNFLSNLWVTRYGVIPNYIYKVIYHQRWWCRKFTKILIFIRLFYTFLYARKDDLNSDCRYFRL